MSLRFIKSCKDLQELIEYVSNNATLDCEQVVDCVNDQLALPSAGTLTNFNTRVIQAIIDYFNQTGVQAPTAAEVCAYLNSLTAGTIDASTKIVLGNCTYGTMADLLSYIQAATTNTLVNDGVNTLTSTVNGISDSDVIVNTVVNSVDANGDLITTVNGVSSSPLDLGAVLDIDDQQISSSVNTMSLTNGGTAPIINSNTLVNDGVNTLTSTVNGVASSDTIVNSVSSSTDVNGDLIITVNGVASTPIDVNPDCADVVDCVEAEPTLNLQDVSTQDFTINGDLVLPASEVAFSTAANTATITVGNQTVTAPIINSNVLSSTGLTLTSTVNGIADSEDLTLATEALILLNTDSVTNTVAGHLIATHTAVDNTSVDINETITSTTAVGTGIQTTNEDGSTNLITFPVINAGTPTAAMEVRVDGNLVTTIPLVQYDVQIDNAGSDFNLVDDQLTFLETNGDSATINFSKYNISATPVTGGIGIYQNGNLITTIPTTASGIAIVDAGNYYTSTDVEGALQELGALVTGGAFTVTDTTTVNLTKTGNDIQADVIIDPATDNLIQATANGLFADADAIAHNYDNTTSGLTATNVQAAIDELEARTDSVINTVTGHKIADHIAADGTTVAINETVTSLGNGTLTGTVVSLPFTDENGTTTNSTVDLAGLMGSSVFQSDDDQVLTAGATSDFDITLTPTTVTDPDSQINKVNYEITSTAKPSVICSGTALSATNKLITTDSLTTNATLPANVAGTPDATDVNNVFLKAEKRLSTTGCGEDVYVPAQRMVTRQTLTPTAIVTANPLIPNFINASGMDYYISTASFSSTVPTGGNYLYDFAWDCQYDFSRPNHGGRINGFITGTGITYRGPHDDWYEKDVNIVLGSIHGKAESSVQAGGTGIALSVNIYHGVDTGIALLMSGGGISFGPYFSTAITFYPTN